MVGPPHLAVADPDRLEQVLWALLDNAVKYSPARSPIRRVDARDGQLAVTVRDRGAGMDDATREHAFEQFYRSDEARSWRPMAAVSACMPRAADAGDGRSDRDRSHSARGRQ